MRTVKRVETMDGTLHATAEAAKRHAEAVYGLALSKLAGELVRIEKYSAMEEFIDSRLPEFCKLAELLGDIQMEEEDAL